MAPTAKEFARGMAGIMGHGDNEMGEIEYMEQIVQRAMDQARAEERAALAAIDPLVHYAVDYGDSPAIECGICGESVEHYAAIDVKEGAAPFPHADTCLWRRANATDTTTGSIALCCKCLGRCDHPIDGKGHYSCVEHYPTTVGP